MNNKTIIGRDLAKYRDLSMARRSIICLCLRHRQIIDLLATDKSRYFARPRPIIDNSLRQFQKNKNRIGGFQGIYLDVRGGLVDIVKSDNFDYFYIILL